MIRLKELRESRQLSQQRLAIEFNVSQTMISKYELGQAEPDIQMIGLMASFFNVSTDYFLGFSDYKFNVKSDDLNENEQYLLHMFKQLNDVQKEKILSYTQGLREG